MKTQVAQSLWNSEDVALYLKVSRSMVYKLGQTGELPCLRVGACLRFDPAVVRAFARGELRGRPGGGVVRLGTRQDPAHESPARYED
jgi:excisionase family DNA binding protein